MTHPAPASQAVIGQAELTRLLDLLEALVDDDACRLDHNNSCQTHFFFYMNPDEQCPVAEARTVLANAGRGERTDG